MLTKQILRRLNFAFTLLCFFGILPYDWGRSRLELTPTRYKIKVFLNRLILYLITTVLVIVGVGYTTDLLLGNLNLSEIFIVGMYVWCGFYIAVMVHSIHAYGGELVYIINNLFKIEKLVKELDFPVEILAAVQASQSQIILTFSNAGEPLSIIQSAGASLLFFEPYDPGRRYVYGPISAMWPEFDNGYVEASFLAAYLLFIRLCYSFLIVLGFWFAMFLQCMRYWASVLLACAHARARAGKIPTESELLLFRIFMVLASAIFGSNLNRIMIPLLIASSFLPIIIGLYGAINFYGAMNFGTYIILPSIALLLLGCVRSFWIQAATTQTIIDELMREWKQCGQHRKLSRSNSAVRTRALTFQKYVRAVDRPYARLGSYFHLNHETFLRFCQQIWDKTIQLLLDF